MSDQPGQSRIEQSPAQGALSAHITKLFKAASRTRYAEEREWATAGYFDQMKQWLEEDAAIGKLRPMTKKKDQKWPTPVTNLFSKTIAMNANALGADIPRMTAMSDNYDARNRRAAEAAEHVIDAANRESGMEILNPTLARRVVLWGWGCVYDTIAFDHSIIDVPDVSQQPASAPDGSVAHEGQEPPQVEGQEQQQGDTEQDLQPSGMEAVPTARLKSYLLSPFEIYIPRDAQDMNLALWKIVRWRRPLGDVKENYPQYAEQITSDTDDVSLSFYYLNTLRSLSFQNSHSNEAEQENCTLMECWCDWTALPKDVQEAIEREWGEQPSEIYEQQGMTKIQAAVEYGIFAVVWNSSVIQWAENPWDGDSPLTFYPWQKDAVAVMPKGLSVELIPLTKSLNRVDSLMMRAVMSTGTGKWLIPTTQTGTFGSGDPVEHMWYDPIGDGKVKPEWINPTPYGQTLIALRNQIVNDFKELGFTNSVAEGEMPTAGTPFRLAAYMGAKAEETRKTQRYLWEQAHELRARKIIKMARKVWTEPRKIETAGFNNRYGARMLEAADIPDSGYTLNVIQDSSKPKTQTEKLQVLQLAQAGGYINPGDRQTKEYVLDTLGLQDVNPTNYLQEAKSDRDLEKIKNGIQPMESPFMDWSIPLQDVANYTFTEEFEELPENVRQGILMWGQYASEKLTVSKGGQLGVEPQPVLGSGGPPSGPPSPEGDGKAGVGGQKASHVLGQVPGAQISPHQVEGAAVREAADIIPNAQPNA